MSDLYSSNEKKLFTSFGLSYVWQDNLQPLHGYKMAIERAFCNNLTGPHVEALRRATKSWLIEDLASRKSPEFEKMLEF